MPYTMTEQEKQALREEYRENIRIINTYIPNPDDHIRVDMSSFNKKLNDPREVWLYKKSLEVKQREIKKKEIQLQLGQELAHLKDPNKAHLYVLNRVMHTDLIPSDEPEAMAYNREVMRQYFLHPEAMIQKRFGDVLKADFGDVAKLAKGKDLESLMVMYSEKNPTLVEDSCSMKTVFHDDKIKALLTPEMAQNYDVVCANFENIIDASNDMKKVNEGYFTVPHHLTDEQDAGVYAMNDFETAHPRLQQLLRGNLANNTGSDKLKSDFRKFFATCEKNGIDLSKPGELGKYVVYPGNGQKATSLATWINVGLGANAHPSLLKLPEDKVAGIQKIFAEDYTQKDGFHMPEIPAKYREPSWKAARDELIFNYAIDHEKMVYELDNGGLGQIAENIKGGLGERLFGSPSREWKNFIQAMKDFENPNHVSYHNSAASKIAANQYLIHKGVRTREQAMALPNPAKDRALLALATIETFQKHEDPAAEKIVPGVQPVVQPVQPVVQPVQPQQPDRQPAIENPAEVEENFVANDNNDLDLSVSVDDLNKSVGDLEP